MWTGLLFQSHITIRGNIVLIGKFHYWEYQNSLTQLRLVYLATNQWLHHILFPMLAFCKILRWANPSDTTQIVWCVSEREATDTAVSPTSAGGFASNYHRLPIANGCLTLTLHSQLNIKFIQSIFCLPKAWTTNLCPCLCNAKQYMILNTVPPTCYVEIRITKPQNKFSWS
jgi:hypothetical protein